MPFSDLAFHKNECGRFVKAIVESHGWRVLVESEPGKGSVFTVPLPKYPGQADGLSAARGNESSHAREARKTIAFSDYAPAG